MFKIYVKEPKDKNNIKTKQEIFEKDSYKIQKKCFIQHFVEFT